MKMMRGKDKGKDGWVVDRNVCDACDAAKPPTQCARCHAVSYCDDVKCQSAAWSKRGPHERVSPHRQGKVRKGKDGEERAPVMNVRLAAEGWAADQAAAA